jgi:hypothetical protein
VEQLYALGKDVAKDAAKDKDLPYSFDGGADVTFKKGEKEEETKPYTYEPDKPYVRYCCNNRMAL